MTQAAPTARSVRSFVLQTDLIGIAAIAGVVALSNAGILSPNLMPITHPGWAFPGILILTFVAQLTYVKIPHDGEFEELAFFEVGIAAGLLLLEPVPLLAAALLGLLLAELVNRREPLKLIYNLGDFAASTCAMLTTYYLVSGDATPLTRDSVLAMVAAMAVFVAVNLSFQAQLLHITAGATRSRVFADEWKLSAFMAIGGIAIGSVGVALLGTPALLPFTAVPFFALWFAYGSAAASAAARERNRWLILLGGALAQHSQGVHVLDEATEAIQRVVGAPERLVVVAAQTGTRMSDVERAALEAVAAQAGPQSLPQGLLPPRWQTGVATRLDLGTSEFGALLLGSTTPYRPSRLMGRTRGWTLAEADAPVLGALTAAVGSAMRAGAAFDALAEETAKLSAVVDNTSDGIAMVDDEGTVRLWSQTMARMTGVDAAGVGGPIDSAPEIVRALVEASRTSGDGAVQVHLLREDGEELDVTVSTVRVREATASAGDDSSGWVSILTVHDETRERRVERMKTDFVATISHELRTPITPIKGYAHLLVTRGDRMTPEKRLQVLQTITDNANHLDRLVEDLLMASRVSGGARLAIQMEMHDLADIVNRAVASFPNMGSRITVTMPDELIEVQCDPTRAVQCLTNLMGNANKYAPGDSPIDVTVVRTGLHARVHVRDHGAGIPVSEHDKVFERFFRREDPFTMRTGGAGLGLHIAREFAVAMGGGLTLQSPETGTGAEFVLHLLTSEAPPVAGVQLAKDHPKPEPGTPPPGFVAGKGRVDTPPTPAADQPNKAVPAGTMDPPRETGGHAAAREPAPTDPVDEAPATADAAMEVA